MPRASLEALAEALHRPVRSLGPLAVLGDEQIDLLRAALESAVLRQRETIDRALSARVPAPFRAAVVRWLRR